MAGLGWLNALAPGAARDELLRCCGSARWAEAMAQRRPFASEPGLLAAADDVWNGLAPQDRLEAFAHHPRIGDRDALRARFASTRRWAAGEQAGAAAASDDVLDALHEGNRAYERRFGYIFIVCATGKTAGEMLDLLRARLANAPEAELSAAAAEQAQITRIRLEKLMLEHRETA